jgi:glycosyltransferase involved in cell wall biosynthesis
MKGSAGSVLMLVENSFQVDPRVRNEAFKLSEAGYRVSVVGLRRPGEPPRWDERGVRVYSVATLTVFEKLRPEGASLAARILSRLQGIVGYVVEYVYFTSACLLFASWLAVREGFDVLHIHNPPDTLFVVGALARLCGKKVVFDHHDLSPELYLSRFGRSTGRGDLVHHGLIFVEKLALRVAHLVIATNESYREIEIARDGVRPERIFVVRNGPDLARVRLVPPDPALRSKARIILGFVGAMNPQDGIDYLLRALRYLAYDLGRRDFFCVLVGTGDSLPKLRQLAHDLELDAFTWFTGHVSDADLVRYLSTADICVDPDPSSPLNDVSTWIKIMEYMALAKPIVAFPLKETVWSAQEAAVYAPPNDEAAFARAVVALMDDPEERARRGALGSIRVREHLAWQIVSRNLLAAYASLLPAPAALESAASTEPAHIVTGPRR